MRYYDNDCDGNTPHIQQPPEYDRRLRFDSSGNTTADAEGRTFIYDAENKQVEVSR